MSDTAQFSPSPDTAGTDRSTWALFWVSVLGLFLELMLIRWIGTEIRVFAYLQNTVLVVCFLGLGLGCWTCREPTTLRQALLPLGFLVALLVPICWFSLGSKISLMFLPLGDVMMFTKAEESAPYVAWFRVLLAVLFTLVIMVLLWDMFVPLGRVLGRLIDDHPRTIWAYSVNVAGSLVGIWLFVLLSGLQQPPTVWSVVLGALFLLLARCWQPLARTDYLLLAGVVVFSWFAGTEPGALGVWWSPYQKLALLPSNRAAEPTADYFVSVNSGGGFQAMYDKRPATIQEHPDRYAPLYMGFTTYDIPPLLHPRPRKMLIVGAGSGNGVAGAVRHGVPDIVAVEIDPVILGLGKEYHPEAPYQQAGVRTVTDDARSYFANCTERFDVISFELLDAHTMTSLTNARLDNYVYTRESFEQARNLLADGGVLVVQFGCERPFIADRLMRTLTEVFAARPLFSAVPFTRHSGAWALFIAGSEKTLAEARAGNPQLATYLDQWHLQYPLALPGTTPVTTDDWPYLYLDEPRIPRLHLVLGLLLVALVVRGLRRMPVRQMAAGWGGEQWHFFFLGAAFMLLEVHNISKAAVVLGHTWQVNAVIISGILLLALLANLVVARLPRLPLAPVYLLLCGSCLFLYSFSLSQLATLPYGTKVVAVALLTCLPILFSGIVFTRSFCLTARKDLALGANLIGALVGGLLQSMTFLTGIRALLLAVTALYVAAMLTRPAAVRKESPVAVIEEVPA